MIERDGICEQRLVSLAGVRLPRRGVPDSSVLERIDIDQVLYVFTRGVQGNAGSGRLPAIHAEWLPPIGVSDHRVRFRTIDAFFLSNFKTLRAIQARLPEEKFRPTSRSMVTNLSMVKFMRLKSQSPQLEIPVAQNDVGWGWELVRLGRDYVGDVRTYYGVS